MRKLVMLFVTILFFFIAMFSLSAHATSYAPPFAEEHRLLKEKTLIKPGMIVYLFHSGVHDLKKTVLGDTLSVFRRGPSCEIKAVGKIRVLSYAGDNYVKGEVVKGEIRLDDIVQAGPSALLIVFPDSRCAR